MQEKTLLKISLICTLVGIFVLFVISNNIEIKESIVNDINGINVDERALIKGTVNRVVNNEKFTIIKLEKKEFIDILLFENFLDLKKGDKIEIRGSWSNDNELTVLGDEIRII